MASAHRRGRVRRRVRIGTVSNFEELRSDLDRLLEAHNMAPLQPVEEVYSLSRPVQAAWR